MKKLGDRLREEREKKGWSQVFVSERLGMKRSSTYANWEYGLREPDAEMLGKLAQLFGVTTDYLIGIEEFPIQGRAYYGGGKDLTDDERAAVEAFLEGYRRRKAEETKRSK